MRIERIELRIVSLPLVRPFRTSSSVKNHIQHILIRVEDGGGRSGWGECASPADPYYCPETTGTCWHILNDFLAPAVLGRDCSTVEDLVDAYRLVKGNNFAKSGLEMACWDLLSRSEGKPLHEMLGGTRTLIESGVSLGIEPDVDALLALVGKYVDEGYRRVKLKIGPGHDVEVLRRVRAQFPDLPLQVDANSAYTLDDLDLLRRLDEFGLLLIEQPLDHDDIIDHARLQRAIETPVCLDESIHSAEDARKAIEIGACRIINIKVSRVGGLAEAKRVHDVCQAHDVPVWCGGMHEFGVGRGANIAIASLPGFTLPGDVSGSDKYYREDVVVPAIRAEDGCIAVPDRPGLGFEPILERIEALTSRSVLLTV
ncbi:o-succinylbenzoate synthase [Isosphaeraceae bacterium EP7]